ncbi:bacteriophage T4 gp5 trimerisation domain-containing protein, partial [Franconibacter helveticus]|uniref:bacteriophage T4 gp5 trimerisation domain-containing protein n=1 Tax=Franconibacter helveticus TaxID=357240 RepID=UPI001EF8AB19
GGVQIPRVGDEVVVDFINGDPDRPIITGRVYNEASMPPWTLPAAATQMGFLSRSKDGAVDNANALRFEDKAGEEQVWIQAQRNLDTQVKKDETHSVGGSRLVAIKQDNTGIIEGSHLHATQMLRDELVGGPYKLKAQGPATIASATGIRLVAGDSVLEMGANGQVNLYCKGFKINASGAGEINTGGTLDLNITKPAAPASVSPTPGEIESEVKNTFNKGEGKA